MKRNFTIIALLAAFNFLVIPAKAQKTKTETKTTVKTKSKTQNPPAKKTTTATTPNAQAASTPLLSAEKMPKFPGGGKAMEQYFVKALSGFKFYQPSGATLNVVIDQTGKVTKATIKNGYRKYE